MHYMALEGLMDGKVKVRPMVLPDFFIEHAGQDEQLSTAGLSAEHICATALKTLGQPSLSPAIVSRV
jgi:1-deoxy-D-xylulose-5-phosphate synthase